MARAEGPNAVQDLDGCRDNTLDANDDDSAGPVTLPFELDFFGSSYTTAFVNNNGNLTFDDALSEFTPFDFTISGTPMIAPFLADIDTTGDGSGLVTYGNTTVDGQDAFCVLWVNVGYFGANTDKLNSFQVLLVQVGDTGDFDIRFNYDKVQWETGDASGGQNGFGGTPAAVGWTNGDGDEEHSFMQPGSFTSQALLDSNPSSGLIHGMLNSGGQLGRYVFEVRNTADTVPDLVGHVDDGGGGDVANAPVEICPVAGGTCRVRNTNQTGNYRASNLPAGDYELTVNPPSDSDATPGRGQVTMGTGPGDTTKDLTLGPAPTPPPAGTTITSNGTTSGGVPVLFSDDPISLETQGCAGGTATFTITVEGQQVRTGSMTEGPPGTYTGSTGPLETSGDGVVTIDIDCPGTDPDETVEFSIYIDPSGHIRDHTGAPVGGATVTLFRSSDPSGPFFPVPDGSAIMSPSNRVNPDESRTDGHFGWDVVAGYYKVRASKDGCVDNATRSAPFAESAVLTIPPPVTDLDIRLFCAADSGGGGGTGGGGAGGGTTGGAGGGGGGSKAKARVASLGRVSVARGKVRVKVTCDKNATGTCAGSVAITTTAKAKKGKKKAKKKAVVIGKAKFKNIKAGKSKIVAVKVNKAGKKLAKKGKVKGKVTVKVRDKSGTAAQTLTKKVTIPKAKKRKR